MITTLSNCQEIKIMIMIISLNNIEMKKSDQCR